MPGEPCCGPVGSLDVHSCAVLAEGRGFLGDGVDALAAAEATVGPDGTHCRIICLSSLASSPGASQMSISSCEVWPGWRSSLEAGQSVHKDDRALGVRRAVEQELQGRPASILPVNSE